MNDPSIRPVRPSLAHRSGGPARSSLARRTLPVVLVAASLAALPAAASAAPKAGATCPKAGATIVYAGKKKAPFARVWRSHGKVYACTTQQDQKPETRYVTKGSISTPRLDQDTFVWTTKATAGGQAVRRVSAFDLPANDLFLDHVKAIPKRASDDTRQDASVDGLRVKAGGFVAWVAGGSTVVVGDGNDGPSLSLRGDGDTSADLYVDGHVAVAGQYEGGAATTKSLVASLKIRALPDDGDSDDCAASYLESFTWKIGGPQAIEAQASGTRPTYACGN